MLVVEARAAEEEEDAVEPDPNASHSPSAPADSNDASHDDAAEAAGFAEEAEVGAAEGTGGDAKNDVSKREAVAGWAAGAGERDAAGREEEEEEVEGGERSWLLLDFLASRGPASSSSLLLSLALLWPGLAGEAGPRFAGAGGEAVGAGAAAKLPKSAQSSFASAAAFGDAAAAARALRSLRARLASFAAAAAAAAADDPVALASAEWLRCSCAGSVTECEGSGPLAAAPAAPSCDDTERLADGLASATPPPLSHACHCPHNASTCVISGRFTGSTVSKRLISAVRYLLNG